MTSRSSASAIGFLDYDACEKLALECHPKLIVAGASAYCRTIDFPRLREIAEFYDFDPFAAASGGCLFMVTGDPEKMLAELSREGIPASVIGSTDDTKACRLVHGEETRYLDLPPADAVLKGLERQS